jgi:hypothetical protein
LLSVSSKEREREEKKRYENVILIVLFSLMSNLINTFFSYFRQDFAISKKSVIEIKAARRQVIVLSVLLNDSVCRIVEPIAVRGPILGDAK